jgi:uncharacterized protein (TIGR00255 family)
MIVSMTGYGFCEISGNGISVSAELRSVNSRFLEVISRLPRSLSGRENDIKELIRQKITRGKINLAITIDRKSVSEIPYTINTSAILSVANLLKEVKEILHLNEEITLSQIMKFSEIFDRDEKPAENPLEWELVQPAVNGATLELVKMKGKEGKELGTDLSERINLIEKKIEEIDTLSEERIPAAREQLMLRVAELVPDRNIIDAARLEIEIALLADKLDVTEECVRFRSHNKLFREMMDANEMNGRSLGFLLQEMNREANTIGSKANDTAIAHRIVLIKEELEKIREQLQNIE